MTTYVPSYYHAFQCIAEKCRHNCCIGWEIDIDVQTYDFYQNISGKFGRKLRDNISDSEGVPHFVLTPEDRCPFLNERNLCDIILNLGEKGLCSICRDHPRFRNFFDSRTEEGLGLCCEEAVRLILTQSGKFTLIQQDMDMLDPFCPAEEEVFFRFRQKMIDIVQERSKPFSVRLSRLLRESGTNFPHKSPRQWAEIFLSLERLESEWKERLEALKTFAYFSFADITDQRLMIALEQLTVYFLFRHLADGRYDGRWQERIAFSVLSVFIIYYLYLSQIKQGETFQLSEFAEITRMYSVEIEYSDENTEILFDHLQQ